MSTKFHSVSPHAEIFSDAPIWDFANYTDITIGLLADTDNLTNVYFSQNFNELKM